MAEAIVSWAVQFFGEAAIEFTLGKLSDGALPSPNDGKFMQFVSQNVFIVIIFFAKSNLIRLS